MVYLVILLLVIIILLLFVILRLKSKETFVLDDAPNTPKIESYQLNDYNYLNEVKKLEDIQLNKENMYLEIRSSEGWELFKKEDLSDDKIKYYWRKKIIQN
jgi:hypothetical protein